MPPILADAPAPPLETGLETCHDTLGDPIDCEGSGQDAETKPGLPWPEPRFTEAGDGLVRDELTGLIWPRSANPLDFPMSWADALERVRQWNDSTHLGRDDWRLPNRRELRSLVSHGARKPALPGGHPFENVFLGWHWTSTTSAMSPEYAWNVHLEGGRMFYSRKTEDRLAWPVAGESRVLPRTGQTECFDPEGNVIACIGTGQDGELRRGVEVLDQLTGLVWKTNADMAGSLLSWEQALEAVAMLRTQSGLPWRLPTINELESLVDASSHSPALPEKHPFFGVGEAYWSSTTSFFETDWAYVLYMHKGAVGVGHKPRPEFTCLAVRYNL
ncbi:DUF1566 domain-containing protein [Desulfohalovibrio reitneri]|uniref:Lcl C-terminal domain-containing protein n=1 Tax=Desulfohalovibrio reitneri TaxID=1307759 RepID=UPI0006913E64|nr:DUF1566 domain-containing protein [Desulfohalovibrio reitneri]